MAQFGSLFGSTQPPLNIGSFGTTQAAPAIGAVAQPAAAPQAPAVTRGLGGEGAAGGQSASSTKSSKDTANLPSELLPLVDSFKKFVKDQKQIKDENSQPRFSVQPILEVGSELDDSLRLNLQKLDVVLQKNSKAIESLKKETTSLVSDAETAYRAIKSDGLSAPSSFAIGQHQYTAPASHKYFSALLKEFEEQMELYSKQIKELEFHLENINKPYMAQELVVIIRKQHETLVALAAEIYAVHEQIGKLENSNLRADHDGTSAGGSSAAKTSTLGPNPFASVSHRNASPMQVAQQPSAPSTNFFSSNAPSAFGATTSSLFSSPATVQQPQQQISALGNRAKRWTTS